MSDSFDKQKMMETLVDPNISSIMIELESGEKDAKYLEDKLKTSSSEIKQRLAYIITHGFVIFDKVDSKEVFRADFVKLNKIMESDDNFSSVIDGLTEIDQYLN